MACTNSTAYTRSAPDSHDRLSAQIIEPSCNPNPLSEPSASSNVSLQRQTHSVDHMIPNRGGR